MKAHPLLAESNGDVQEVHTFDATQVDYLLTLPQFVIDVLPRDIRDKVAAARNKKDAQPETQEPKKEDPTKDNTKHSVSLQLACGAIIKKNKDGTDTNPPLLQFRPFRPSVGGLLQARKVCRSEMAKIVNEVDLITKEPKLAIDTSKLCLRIIQSDVLTQLFRARRALSRACGLQATSTSKSPLPSAIEPPTNPNAGRPDMERRHASRCSHGRGSRNSRLQRSCRNVWTIPKRHQVA